MAFYSTNEFKGGLKVMLDGDPCAILESEFVKPGKGQAFNRVRLRNLLNGRIWERTFKSGETLEAADVSEASMEFLYHDGEFYHFMNTETFEQIAVPAEKVGDANLYLKENDMVEVVLFGDEVIGVELPITVELTVTQTEPGFKGDTATGGSKPATLETGLVIQVPLFIEEGTKIKVNTGTGEYIERVS